MPRPISMARRGSTARPVGGGGASFGFVHGINVSGMEHGGTPAGGTPDGAVNFGNLRLGALATDYFQESQTGINYLASQGWQYARIPFRWERAQPTLSAALNTTHMGELNTLFSRYATANMKVMPDLHNYAAYWTNTSSSSTGDGRHFGDGYLTSAHLEDFWSRFVTYFRTGAGSANYNTILGWDLMNEPTAMISSAGSYTSSYTYGAFSGSLGSWNVWETPGTGESFTYSTAQAHSASGSAATVKNFAVDGSAEVYLDFATTDIRTRGTTLSCWVYPVGTGTWLGRLQVNGGGGFANGPQQTLVAGQWNEVQWTPDSTTASTKWNAATQVSCWVSNNSAATRTFYVDDYTQGNVTGAYTEGELWQTITQNCVNAIRATGDTKPIYVPCYDYSTPGIVNFWHPNGPWITDSANNTIYQIHHYYAAENTPLPSGVGAGWDSTEMNTWQWVEEQAVMSGYSTTSFSPHGAGSSAHLTRHLERAAMIKTFADKQAGTKIAITEFGIPFSWDPGYASWNLFGRKILDYYTTQGWEWMYWCGHGDNRETDIWFQAYINGTENSNAPVIEAYR